MLRKFLTIFLGVILLTPLATRNLLAAEKTEGQVNLSDEIYADLSLRHALDHVSIYYFDDNINDTISINSDKNWDPASTIKLYVAMYAFDQVAAGKISLDQIVTISDQNVAPSVSVENGYTPLTSGQNVSVYELLDRMITQSGNTSYNTLLDILDRREITKYIHDLGLVNSSVGAKLNLNDAQEAVEMATPGFGQNITTADDFARAFILINGKRIPGSPSLFDMLSRQKLNDMIPAYLPKNVLVAHKTGELDPYYHDGGIIVDANRQYVLSIFTDDGDPSLVAHLSQLIYTKDASLIGSSTAAPVSEGPLPPIDSLVAEANGQQVLAAATQNQNVTLPPITASDVGMKPTDVNSVLSSSQLPPVIIPADSPLHFLVDLGGKINSLDPIPGLRINSEASSLKLKLAEANNLISRNKNSEAASVLSQVDSSLTSISKDKALASNVNAQTLVNQISETRFEILKNQFVSLDGQAKQNAIKEIARQARNAANSVVPNIPIAIQKESLTQAPVVGKVISSTTNSITVQTPNGNNVTVETDPQIKTRDSASDKTTTKNTTQISNGTEIAIAGITQGNPKASFIMTNLPVDSTTQTPVSVVKVDSKNNVLVVSKNGVPTQVDLTKQTIIKGPDDAASLSDIKTGDTLVVHGTDISTQSSTPSGNVPTQTQNNATANPAQTSTPAINANIPSSKPSTQTSTQTVKQNNTPAPAVIKGKIIEIVGTTTPAKAPVKKEKPAPQPAVLAPETKEKKK